MPHDECPCRFAAFILLRTRQAVTIDGNKLNKTPHAEGILSELAGLIRMRAVYLLCNEVRVDISDAMLRTCDSDGHGP